MRRMLLLLQQDHPRAPPAGLAEQLVASDNALKLLGVD